MMRSLWLSQRARVFGIVFLALLMVGVWLTYALFTNKFATYDKVTLQAERVGLQLPQRADVKIRGVIVGEVLAENVTDDGAELTLGIFPEEIDTIPADVEAAILPKTLFGQKYVSLDSESTARDAGHLQAGSTIEQSKVAIEVQAVLDDIYPLLRAIQPADLNNTLNAMATALEGRGEKLGQTLETLDDYLRKLNPEIPVLLEDLRKLSKVSDVYADVLPQVGQILRDGIHVATTLEDREKQLTTTLSDVTAFSETTRKFLNRNEDTLIRVGEVGAPVVDTLARYSPMFPCLINGLENLRPRLAEAFRGYTLHIDLELLPRQARRYSTADKPRYGEARGPGCGTLPNPSWSQDNPFAPVPDIDDGVDEPTGKGMSRAPAAYRPSGLSGASYVGTPAERRVLDELLAPSLGVSAEDVPALGSLMVGPMARGAEVTLR